MTFSKKSGLDEGKSDAFGSVPAAFFPVLYECEDFGSVVAGLRS